ncbi:MAG: trigger factor [Flavobacteriales bacterium]|nr:trigger factor [Flavobacteriia bacterium]NCP05934.1 trigger factor [Flavobacteriales bacterium]PIV94445.1 MAG: trigger factor [Flavobacteriaceae bacterium CG17_big_fil_post_rev_8_21_14_2_50_33_15]PIY10060.1 MAG: trigger factor [Flavobacteriaceae bacterium CG_4_10_14_3_um_filter_33_47]PJB18339.1 MAG: trigger factor [Flavobacteriaceae bacterium CG_4_9_14_3_um_filter_33_16]
MNITRENLDALNAVVKVDIAKEDYSDKVEKILANYRKTANIPGFRKGHVPMGMVKKQYGKAVLVDEVNKLLQDALNKYLTEEKLDVLGQPLPKTQDTIDWDAEGFSFEFELGLAPEFEIELKSKKAITQYNIVADSKMIDEQVETIQKQYGKLVSQQVVENDSEITGTYKNDDHDIENTITLTLDKFKEKSTSKKFVGAKVGDIISLETKGLYTDEHDLMHALKVGHDKVHGLDISVTFTITEINKRELAELDQELFDKLFGKDVVKSVTELKSKIKEDAEKQFIQQADQKLLNDVTEYLVDSTKFDLPAEFLQKWLRTAGEQPLDVEQAKEEYDKSEKSLRYQLIEGKLITDNNIQVTIEDITGHAKEMIKGQMAQFGQLNPSDKELEDIAARVLSNKDEARRISEQLISQKLLNLYKEKANLKVIEVTYENFIKEAYSKK